MLCCLCFLCFLCKTLINLLLVVPETRVVVNVRLCAFVDHGRLTRNLKNRSWAQKCWVVVCWTLEDSGKGFFQHGIDFPGPWKVRWILRSCVVESRVLQNPPATEFYFWLLKGGYFRVDQHGLAYLQISSCLDYKLVDTFHFWSVVGLVQSSLTMIEVGSKRVCVTKIKQLTWLQRTLLIQCLGSYQEMR